MGVAAASAGRAFARHAEAYSKLMNRLAASTDLKVLDGEVFENIPPGRAVNSAERETFFFCLDLLELVETVFFDLNLSSEHSWNHPGNSGWKRDFEYWAQQKSIKNTWQAQQLNFSTAFRNFFDDLVNQQAPAPKEQRL
jgi:hypothetical protein